MAESKMSKVADILDVKIGEEFKVKYFGKVFELHYFIDGEGMKNCLDNYLRDDLLMGLLRGDLEIVKIKEGKQ